jgi:hypothetical protein
LFPGRARPIDRFTRLTPGCCDFVYFACEPMSGQCQGARGVAAAIGRNMANRSNIAFLVNCYDFANLRETLIPLAIGNTVGAQAYRLGPG